MQYTKLESILEFIENPDYIIVLDGYVVDAIDYEEDVETGQVDVVTIESEGISFDITTVYLEDSALVDFYKKVKV